MTLLEVLVVIGIMAALAAMLLPSLSEARSQAKGVVCLSNERQIAFAVHGYTEDYGGVFPIAQYFDAARFAFVAWDTITYVNAPQQAQAGLIWEYTKGNEVQQCPAYTGPSMTTGDPYTGYNYNTTYIGRGHGEGEYRTMGDAPAVVGHVRFPSQAALIGDGGWASGANKFMRAPLDSGVAEATAHAGAQAYRHGDRTGVVYIDGHAVSTGSRFRKPDANPYSELLLDWPKNGFLSEDDSAYAHR
ncbi:MAG: type II secretion system protein [Planctomycetota bacterium]|jgi:prepilin-type processing-associated H-X9-DG protein